MTETALEATLRRDRTIVVAALVVLTAVAWGYTLWLVQAMRMGGMEMAGTRMDANPFGVAMLPSLQPWTATEFVLMFAMWAIMMVGMMIPSAAPMIMIYARVGRHAERQGKPLAGTGYFAAGYLLAWIGFSLIATIVQWLLQRASLLTPVMAAASSALGGLVLITAGLYQWTPAKDTCLRQCRAPLIFIQRHGGFRREAFGSMRIGFVHGRYCIGCCWALMALLFVGGIMNVLWIAGIAAFVMVEKVLASGRMLSRVAGLAFVAGGIWLMAGAVP